MVRKASSGVLLACFGQPEGTVDVSLAPFQQEYTHEWQCGLFSDRIRQLARFRGIARKFLSDEHDMSVCQAHTAVPRGA